MELRKALDDLRIAFGPNDYNIIRKNCNHFANAMCFKLLGKAAPGYVNRLADVGVCCDCLLPRKMLENAPVGDPDAANNSNGSSFGSPGSGIYARGPSAPQPNAMRAFAGTGARLGGDTSTTQSEGGGLMGSLLGKVGGSGGTSSSSSNNNKASDDLTDRREKARKAALARLEKQQQSQEQKDK